MGWIPEPGSGGGVTDHGDIIFGSQIMASRNCHTATIAVKLTP